ncbi:MAG: hypothetical protein ACI4LM_03385 [Anaerovoracaceae bacterium]
MYLLWVMYFYKENDEACGLVDKALKELRDEDPRYTSVDVTKISEDKAPELAKRYPHEHVPCLFVGKNDKYEYEPGQTYDEVKANVRRIMDLYINSSIL